MKIGFIYTKFYPLTSSASVHGYQLVKNLKELGHEIFTIGVGTNELTVDYPKSIGGLYSFYKSIDIVYIRVNPWLKNDWLTLLKLLSFGSKKIIWEVNTPCEEALANYEPGKIPKFVTKWVTRQNNKRHILSKFVDVSISVSEVLKNDMVKRFGIKQSYYIPNGSDPELFKPSVKDTNNPLTVILKNKFVVVWAGNAAFSWQGTSLIGEVASRINEVDRDVYFLYISNVSIYNKVILPNVISLGEINYLKLPEFLNFADVALCLYNSCSWCPLGFYNSPLKMYDYMSMGLPVIGSNMGQIAEVIEDGQNGLLTDNSIEDIVSRILELKRNTNLRHNLGSSARRLIEEKYNWHNTAKQTSNLIEELL